MFMSGSLLGGQASGGHPHKPFSESFGGAGTLAWASTTYLSDSRRIGGTDALLMQAKE